DGAGHPAVRGAPVRARARAARRRLRRRPDRLGRPDPAVHGRRSALGGGAGAGGPGALDRRWPVGRPGHRPGLVGLRLSVPDLVVRLSGPGRAGPHSAGHRGAVRPGGLPAGGRGHDPDPDRHRPPVAAPPASRRDRNRRGPLMAIVLALAIGVLTASGAWLVLRPRTFQVLIGLTLLSYAVNLFIFSTGGLRIGAEPVLRGPAGSLIDYADPLPQALVLTAIVIGFATTALLLVVILAARGLTGGDHVDGSLEEEA